MSGGDEDEPELEEGVPTPICAVEPVSAEGVAWAGSTGADGFGCCEGLGSIGGLSDCVGFVSFLSFVADAGAVLPVTLRCSD